MEKEYYLCHRRQPRGVGVGGAGLNLGEGRLGTGQEHPPHEGPHHPNMWLSHYNGLILTINTMCDDSFGAITGKSDIHNSFAARSPPPHQSFKSQYIISICNFQSTEQPGLPARQGPSPFVCPGLPQLNPALGWGAENTSFLYQHSTRKKRRSQARISP